MKTSRSSNEPGWLHTIKPGTIDLRIFDQDTYWVNRHTEIFQLQDMTSEYRAAVLTMLTERAIMFHLHTMANAVFDMFDAHNEDTTTGDMMTFSLTGESIADASPAQWIESTPLVRKLRSLQKLA